MSWVISTLVVASGWALVICRWTAGGSVLLLYDFVCLIPIFFLGFNISVTALRSQNVGMTRMIFLVVTAGKMTYWERTVCCLTWSLQEWMSVVKDFISISARSRSRVQVAERCSSFNLAFFRWRCCSKFGASYSVHCMEWSSWFSLAFHAVPFGCYELLKCIVQCTANLCYCVHGDRMRRSFFDLFSLWLCYRIVTSMHTTLFMPFAPWSSLFCIHRPSNGEKPCSCLLACHGFFSAENEVAPTCCTNSRSQNIMRINQ